MKNNKKYDAYDDFDQINNKKDDQTRSQLQEQINKNSLSQEQLLELENIKLLKQGEEKLNKALFLQKETTKELQRQREKIENIEFKTVKTYENVKKGRKTVEDIKEEGILFRIIPKFIKDFFKRTDSEEKSIEIEIEKRTFVNNVDNNNSDIGNKIDEINNNLNVTLDSNVADDCIINLIDKIKEMKKENEVQSKEIKIQTESLRHTSRINKKSKGIMNETIEKMKKL